MQWLAEVCVKRPVFTWVLTLSLVVIGASSFGALGLDRFPKIDFPVVIVTTILPGGSPETVESDVTNPIEEALNSVEGIDELTSNSYEGLSVVSARFVLERDVTDAAADVRDRISAIGSMLPDDAEAPTIRRIDPSASPILYFAVLSDRSPREVTDYADRVLARQLESLQGVGGVSILGGREREVEVRVDPARLAAVSMTVGEVQAALLRENVELPGGSLTEGARAIQVRVLGRIGSPEEFANITIGTRGGRVIRLGDVAEVLDGEEEPSSAALLSGEEVVIIAVRSQSGENTVAVVDRVLARMDTLRESLPAAYTVRVVRDESEPIRNAIHAVEEHLIIGGIFAALVVLLFLWNGRSTVIAALAIPTSIIATFALIRVTGMTLNTITMLALTLSVGIVIDDAIVVLENIVRFIEEKKMAPARAAVLATKEIGLAVLATTLSLVAVFLPIAFMDGIVGRFMAGFGYTMSFAIMISLFVSFTLTPMLASRWLKGPLGRKPGEAPVEEDYQEEDEHDGARIDPPPGDRAEEREEYLQWQRGKRVVPNHHVHNDGEGGRLYKAVERGYLRLLAWCMRRRWVVGIVLVVVIALMVPIARALPKGFLPTDDGSRFEVTIRAPEGMSLAESRVITERVSRAIRDVPGVTYTLATIGSPPGDPSGRGANSASIYVQLTPPGERELSEQLTMAVVRTEVLPRFADLNLRTIVSPLGGFGGGGSASAAIQYVISGPDLDTLSEYSQAILAEVRDLPDVVDADTTLVTGSPAYEVRVDRARAADLGVSVVDIANALRILVGGVEASSYTEGGERYDVRVRAPLDARTNPESLGRITVPSRSGTPVRLADVTTIEEGTGPAFVSHSSRMRQVTIYCNVAPGGSEAEVAEQFEQARIALGMPSTYRASLTGRSREMGRAFGSFLLAVGMSLLFMYLVLAAQFESWIHPITILASLPLTIPFALLSLLILGGSLNLYSALGILVLFGIVKKNSILQVDHIRALRRKGYSRADAVMVGNKDRLRPILMTTVAFVAGMIPLVLSTGAGSGTNQSMGTVVAGGQTLSLLLTLLATPVIFSWLDDISNSRAVKFLGRMIRGAFGPIDRFFSRGDSHAAPETEQPSPPATTPSGAPAE
jgi:HAE1 family hydrophobic/amphiphilic exporter-1